MSSHGALEGELAFGELIELIQEVTRLADPIGPDTPLISSGIIDSFDVVALLAAFEMHYGVEITPEEVDVTYFDTPRDILARIRTRQS